MKSAEDAWSFTGGTGKLKGLKGKGKDRAKGAADGIEGEYQLP